MNTIICILLVSCIGLSENYRILGLFPLPSKSHNLMFETLMKHLAIKGHEVDVLSHFPLKEPPPGYNDLSLRGSMPILVNNVSIPLIQARLGTMYDTVEFILQDCGLHPCKVVLNTNIAKQLKITDKKYDLVITEFFGSDCMLGFAHHFKVPVISMTSSVVLPWGGDRVGNPDNPSYIPNYLVSYLSPMSLMERVINTIVLLAAKVAFISSIDSNTAIAQEFFGPDLPDLRDLARNVSLVFLNSHFSINQARPTVPNFIEVGGLHIEKQKPLPKHFESSLAITSHYKGVIYLSMGSMVLTETLPTEKLRALFEAFRELPYKVLWKAARENFPKELDIPANIQFESWMPQLDILCHPNVKLFVTHGGLLGTQEGIYCGVPRLGFPFFADQESNLKTSEAMGLAIRVGYNNITKASILEAANLLLNDPKYVNNVKRVSKMFRDRPLSAMDTAIYWVEYVIRHNGAPQLRSVGADLPWYQYFLVDVIAILITMSITVVTVIYYLIAFVLRKFMFSKIKSKSD